MAASTPSYIQVAPDSSGKKVIMEQVLFPDGTTGYRQIAQLEGAAGDAIQEMLVKQIQMLGVLRAILAKLDGNPLDDTYMEL